MAARSASSERLPLAEKICLVTNCGLLQGGPDAAEFQRQGASLILQTHDLAAAKPVLERDGVRLHPSADATVFADIGTQQYTTSIWPRWRRARVGWGRPVQPPPRIGGTCRGCG
jgi:hypothetical protein